MDGYTGNVGWSWGDFWCGDLGVYCRFGFGFMITADLGFSFEEEEGIG